MNVLIFSVSIGSGHDQVAHTLRNEFIRQNALSRVKIINTISYISPLLDKVILDSYLNILRFYPRAWGKLYEKTNQLDPIIDVNDIANRLITSKFRKTAESFEPDIIVCTHSFPSAIISSLKHKKRIVSPLINVITDFNIHSSYINENTDYYIIPHEDLTYIMENFGVSKNKVLPFGIPIRKEFGEVHVREDLLLKHGFEDKKTILVIGGGLGLGGINNIVKAIDGYMENVHIIAVAGRNNRLESKLKGLSTKNRLSVYGFVNNMPELMELSDCVITKPGGVSTAEILSREKPLVIFSPLPGQEYENAEFLLNSGAAVTTSDVKRIPVLIDQIFSSDIRMKCYRQLAGLLKKPHSTYDIVHFLESKYDTE
ncbi:MAG TPA: glycosyltransferase [Bacillota bacterium]|nr:glycosyltransferase [Bacillota bacterium]HPL53311.1 glycosyltransferase [Bacillota bacterium]